MSLDDGTMLRLVMSHETASFTAPDLAEVIRDEHGYTYKDALSVLERFKDRGLIEPIKESITRARLTSKGESLLELFDKSRDVLA